MNSLSWLLNKGMIANIVITRMNHKVDRGPPQLVLVASTKLINITNLNFTKSLRLFEPIVIREMRFMG